ncbi:hypothetical protein B0O99DRAFT_636882 [Bisporella sp. PMI_857]|nr:hypothetical protein B0O99DRAFT_636882 [Bisporella sp. PMI_857]
MMDRAYIHKVRVSFRVDSFPCFQNKRLPDRLDMTVQAHWDPHDTCDNRMNIMMNIDERRAWLIGLMQLRISGVPEPYMDRIFALLHGRHQPYPLATPNYHPISELLQLEKQGLLSPSATQESLPSMKLRQEEKKRLQAVIQSAQGQDATDELLRQKRKFALAHLGTKSVPLPFSKADQSNAAAGYKLGLQAPKSGPDDVPVPPVMPNSSKENIPKEREKPEAPLGVREDDVQAEKEQAEVARKEKAKHEAWLAEQVRLGYDGFFC